MTSLMGSAQLALRRAEQAGASDPAVVMRTLQTIKEQPRRLARLVALLLDTSRLVTGHLDLDRREEDLAGLVARVVEQLGITRGEPVLAPVLPWHAEFYRRARSRPRGPWCSASAREGASPVG